MSYHFIYGLCITAHKKINQPKNLIVTTLIAKLNLSLHFLKKHKIELF